MANFASVSAFQRVSNRGFLIMAQAAGRYALSFLYRLIGRRFVERRVNDYRMLLDMHDQGLSRALMLFRSREVDHKVMLERIVRPGMRIFDIGGNIGYYPLMELSLLGGTGELVVIEPLPGNVALLERNLRLNDYSGIPVLEAAVSDVPTERKFFVSKQSNLGTFHPKGEATQTLTGATLNVETVTVPMLAQRFGPPDLLRMDIEGHEVEVFGSMVEDISRGAYAPIIVFETHLDRYGPDHDMEAALRKLFALGYGAAMVSTSSDKVAERLRQRGYKLGTRIATDAVYRTLVSDIGAEDAIDLICRGGVRTVMLAKK